MRYEAVIGLELHIQLSTDSKLFSSSPAAFGASPNTHVNEIDLGYPGVLPVLNAQAVEFAVIFGLALGSDINQHAVFMRKNYFYPDLPKGYQISQLDDAIILGGEVILDEFDRTVRINRGQLEEDAGKSVHDAFSDRTGIDLNRAGVPLIELVSEPDMRSAKEAVAYMRKIHHLVRYLGISDGNMQEGSFRCDANVSIREKGNSEYNPRVELKNINSFRFVEQAINIEIERQSEVMAAGGRVEQETRLFDPDRLETRTMRSKEEANDYRYFPDPDLLPVCLDAETLEGWRKGLPELPQSRKLRYEQEYSLSDDQLQYLLQDKSTGDYFDVLANALENDGKLAVNWMQSELQRLLVQESLGYEACKIDAQRFAGLLQRVKDNTVSVADARKLIDELWADKALTADALIESKGLKQVNDDTAIEAWVDEVIAANPEQVQSFKEGQAKILGFLVGQVLKKSQGKANPKAVNALLQKKLQN